jgi:hypothetical protein
MLMGIRVVRFSLLHHFQEVSPISGGFAMLSSTRRAVLVLALLLTFVVAGARPAQAQTFTAPQIQQMVNIRVMQANALNGLIQQLSTNPTAQVQGSSVQQTIALYQGALATVQYQINQLQLLGTALNQAFAVDALIQNPQNQLIVPQLQAALANVQYQISTLQSTITAP